MNRRTKKTKFRKFARIFALLASILIALSCRMSNTGEAERAFKDDSAFFLGLQAADRGEEAEAINLFVSARDSAKTTALVSRRSAESLTLLGNVAERANAARKLAAIFGDDDALLISARELFAQEEFAETISMTEKIDLASAPNELVKIRFDSMLKKNDSRFEREFYEWTISRPISAEHLEFYKKFLEKRIEDFQKRQAKSLAEYEAELKFRQNRWKESYKDENGEEPEESQIPTEFEDLKMKIEEIPETEEQNLIDLRIHLYRKNYHEAFRLSKKAVEIYNLRNPESDEKPYFIDEQILSDIGKAHLYGTESVSKSVAFFESFAERLPDNLAFYAHFYIARLHEKSGKFESGKKSFKNALETAGDEKKFDNALWYFLSFLQKNSKFSDMFSVLSEFGGKISDREYFDDLFESIFFGFLSKSKWQDFYDFWKNAAPFMSDDYAERFSYISARLLQENLVADESANIEEIFRSVLQKKGGAYYKVCALERLSALGIDFSVEKIGFFLRNCEARKIEIETQQETEGETKSENPADEKTAEPKKNPADVLLAGYATFGFPARIYPEWILNRAALSLDAAISASRFLHNCAQFDSKYNIQSLRIADRTRNSLKDEIPEELLKLCFPRFFQEMVSKTCAENSIEEPLFFALIRTESFFDPKISSAVGASGLTQLMEATAKDEARKLKIGDDFDILDPETNLRMGCHYLAHLISRVEENAPILALFAYNGGLTNVRNWLKKSNREWKKAKKTKISSAGFPLDIFLETVPFKETRGYGRSVVAAASLYGFLYYEKNPVQTVREIFGLKTEEKEEKTEL